MTLKEIIGNTNFVDVWTFLIGLYDDFDFENSKATFSMAFEKTKTIETHQSKLRLHIEFAEEKQRGHWDVYGTYEGDKEKYALDFTSWGEWLSAEVDGTVCSKLKPYEIAAHCLWEMTYFGFDDGEIPKMVHEISNEVFNMVTTYFMQGYDTESENRYRLTMTEDEWEMMAANSLEDYDEDELKEFRNEIIECMQGEFTNSKLTAEKAKTVKQCIDEMEQASLEAIWELFMRLTRWQYETRGLAYIPESEDSHPPGIRLLDWGGTKITESALKHILITPSNF
jgi:hypothetical protein